MLPPFSEPISLINLLVLLIFHFLFNKLFFANSTVLEFFIIFITASIFSIDTEIPNKMCALSEAFLRSNLILFVKVFSLKSTNSDINSYKLRIFGFPSTIANVLKPKEDSIDVNLYNCLFTVSGSTFLLRSKTTRIPL